MPRFNTCVCSCLRSFCSFTYPECRISSQLQQAADRSGAEVSGGDVQGSAEVKIAAGGIHFWSRGNTEMSPRYESVNVARSVILAHLPAATPATPRGWGEGRRSRQRNEGRSCWSSGCAETGLLPEIRASGQNLLHPLRRLKTHTARDAKLFNHRVKC